MAILNIITQRSFKKPVQCVVEGHTNATYGITPTNPSFFAIGQDAVLVDESNPVIIDNRVVGDINRKAVTKVFEENIVKYSARMMKTDNDQNLFSWFFSTPDGEANSPDESRTFFFSYSDSAGTETFQVYTGCKPKDVTFSYDTHNYIILEAIMTFKTVLTTAPVVGSGSFITVALTGTPLLHLDSAQEPFEYDGNSRSIESFSMSINYVTESLTVLGAITPLDIKYAQRNISGSMVIYKKDDALQIDARAATEKVATYVLYKPTTDADSKSIVLNFTGFRFLPSGEEVRGDSSEATKENKSWEANKLIVNSTVPS